MKYHNDDNEMFSVQMACLSGLPLLRHCKAAEWQSVFTSAILASEDLHWADRVIQCWKDKIEQLKKNTLEPMFAFASRIPQLAWTMSTWLLLTISIRSPWSFLPSFVHRGTMDATAEFFLGKGQSVPSDLSLFHTAPSCLEMSNAKNLSTRKICPQVAMYNVYIFV